MTGARTTEADLMRLIQIRATELGARLLRNNCGALLDALGNIVAYGVGGRGGADLIGWVTRDGVALFLAVEVKTPHSRTPKKRKDQQDAFLAAVRAAGGIAGVARSVADLDALLSPPARDTLRSADVPP